MKNIITRAIALFIIATTATAQQPPQPTPKEVLIRQAELAKNANDTIGAAAFAAAANGATLTQQQKDFLVQAESNARSVSQVVVADAIQSVLLTNPVSTPVQNTNTNAVCNRLLRNGQICGCSGEQHVNIGGNLFCPNDTCKSCGKRVIEHVDGRCNTTAANNDVSLAPTTRTVTHQVPSVPVAAPVKRGTGKRIVSKEPPPQGLSPAK